ncbi:MAG TPA: bifunctional DNA-formamidopyrimidine glycosylase/DNA-(apurinic or apyrimidinic site) lyase [Bryobacteraceae bacterium]|nr:bifunctional DNA-formamidopyrimidine glycosylase/DNA-(apurinic or apyrimidinic site) lyase [Bryobacteraceae bacterium]
MPELPEVETIVRELAPRLRGRHIVAVEVLQPRIVRHSRVDVCTTLPGKRIADVRRHGKFILVDLNDGCITIHLGMTGKLRFDGPPGPHTRAIFTLDDGSLLYDDPRMFGAIECGSERVERLGPDALTTLAPEKLRRKAHIKAVLLNQSVFSGVGNIYADEALFRAGIRPTARNISAPRAAKLLAAVDEVLREAIEFRGSSVSDYVDTEGRSGSFQTRHCVYGRANEPCVKCGTPIKKIVVAGRGTHYCPKCQG